MNRTDKIFRALFVAMAVGLGWGIRGHFGGSIGAMFPGAMLGLSFAYVSGQKSMFRWMPLLEALSALSISIGGNMTYDLLHGYAASGPPPAHWINYAYGFLMLFLQGGSWGIFGTAVIALLLDKKNLKFIEVVRLAGFICFFGWLFFMIIVKWWGYQVKPSRGDSLVAHFGGAAGLILWLYHNKKWFVLRGAMIGFVGFGLGMSLGRMNANILDYSHIAINSWNMMEITCGAVGGFSFTYFMIERNYKELQLIKPQLRIALLMGSFYVLGIIPLLQWLVTKEKEVPGMQDKLESWGYSNASIIAGNMLTWINMIVIMGFVLALFWFFLNFKDKKQFAWFPILALGLTIMLIDLLARLYFYYPPPKEGYIDMHTCTIGIYLIMVLYVVLREWKFPDKSFTFSDRTTEKIPWKAWVVGIIAAYFMMLVVSSFTNAELMKRKISHTRFPVWNRLTDGPFEKMDSTYCNIEEPVK
jgi:hypothetical protein